MLEIRKCLESIEEDLQSELAGSEPSGGRTSYIRNSGYREGIVKALDIIKKYGEMYD